MTDQKVPKETQGENDRKGLLFDRFPLGLGFRECVRHALDHPIPFRGPVNQCTCEPQGRGIALHHDRHGVIQVGQRKLRRHGVFQRFEGHLHFPARPLPHRVVDLSRKRLGKHRILRDVVPHVIRHAKEPTELAGIPREGHRSDCINPIGGRPKAIPGDYMSEDMQLPNPEGTLLPFQEEVRPEENLERLRKKRRKLPPILAVHDDIVYIDDYTAGEGFRKQAGHAPLNMETRLNIAHRGHTVLVYLSFPKKSEVTAVRRTDRKLPVPTFEVHFRTIAGPPEGSQNLRHRG